MKIFQPGELRLLWPFYLDGLLSPMLFFIPVFFVVYFNQIGLSAAQMGLLMSVTALSSLIFEVPTGAFADLYGRKVSVLLSFLLCSIGYLLVPLTTDFLTLLGLFAFIGFASTLASGSKEAWVVDLLKGKPKTLFGQFSAKLQAFGATALILSGFVGAALVKIFGISVVWPATSVAYLISLFALCFAKENRLRRDEPLAHTCKDIARQTSVSFHFCAKHPVLIRLLIAAVILLFSMNFSSVISWTPVLQELGLPIHSFGYLWSALALATLLAAVASHTLLRHGKERHFIIGSSIFMVIITVSILWAKFLLPAILILFGQFFFRDLMQPAERVYIHHFIPSQLRATIGSIEGMLLSLVSIISLPLTGLLVDTLGGRWTIFLTALVLLPYPIIYYSLKNIRPSSKKA